MSEKFIKGLIRPSRREFITGATAMAAAACLPKCADAFFMNKGGATPPAQVPAQPAAAALYGFNRLTFYDDFTSINTIDVNNTLHPGFNWYVSQQAAASGQPVNVMPASNISVSNSLLTMTPTTGQNYIGCVGWIPGSPATTVGNPIKPGGAYFEVSMAFNPALQNNGWPAFLAYDLGIQTHAATGSSWTSAVCELDFFEAFSGPDLEGTDWHWLNFSTQYKNTNYEMSGIISNYQVQNKYGCLNVPQSKNGGQGIIQRYLNETLVSSNVVNDYTSAGVSSKAQGGAPNGWMSPLDSSSLGFNIFLQSGINQPIVVDYVAVWQ